MKKSYTAVTKFLCDYLPLIVFFTVYKFTDASSPLTSATIFMVITTFIALGISYFLTKKIPAIALFSGIVLGVFGGLTVFLENDLFIKIKPTVLNLLFAAILLYGFFTKKPLLSHLFGEQLKMSDKAWLTLSMRWAIFFIFLATLNEIIWRNFSTDFWVQFKVFGMTPISLIFTLLQAPFMMKEMKKSDEKKRAGKK